MLTRTMDVRGPVHVADFGGTGPTMLLVHGLGGSHLNWASVGAALAEEHRVSAIDLPGFGLSPIAGRRSTIAANVGVVEAVIGQLGAPAILVGNSMGGLISLGVAARRPESVAALVLVDAALPRPRGERLRMDPALREFLFAYTIPWLGIRRVRRFVDKAGPEALVLQVLRSCCVDIGRVDRDVLHAHVELERVRMAEPRWDVAMRAATASLLHTLAMRSRVEGWVSGLTVPTMLMHGREDRIVSFRSASAAADLRPDWEFHVFEDVGHVPMLETPGLFVDALRGWVQRQNLAARNGSAVTQRDVA